jgi:hypothetical protein
MKAKLTILRATFNKTNVFGKTYIVVTALLATVLAVLCIAIILNNVN